MILTHANAKRLQLVAMNHPLRSADDRIRAATSRDRHSGLALLLSVNY